MLPFAVTKLSRRFLFTGVESKAQRSELTNMPEVTAGEGAEPGWSRWLPWSGRPLSSQGPASRETTPEPALHTMTRF